MPDTKPKVRSRADAGAAPAALPAYERKKGGRVWARPGFEGISYSDGDEAERQLLELLKRARDLTTTSDELDLAIEDWIREAHLSSARSNLLRPLDLKSGQRVLELGAGCGPLTRYLGELGLEVDAVEGNMLRAQCAAERCRDLDKVRVFADHIASFRSDRKYDVVTLIGVREYARDYGGSNLRSFDESAVWSVLERNGLLGDFANSFLVVASLAKDNPLDDGAWLAYRFSPQRLKQFAIRTRFARNGRGEIAVSKEIVDSVVDRAPVGIDGDFRVEQRIGEQPYVRGRMFANDFIDGVGRGYGPRDLAQFLKPWIDYLAARSTGPAVQGISSLRVPGEYLDCIPTNLIVDGQGKLHPIDLEFVVAGEVPLASGAPLG